MVEVERGVVGWNCVTMFRMDQNRRRELLSLKLGHYSALVFTFHTFKYVRHPQIMSEIIRAILDRGLKSKIRYRQFTGGLTRNSNLRPSDIDVQCFNLELFLLFKTNLNSFKTEHSIRYLAGSCG